VLNDLISTLDLSEYIRTFQSFFARQKPIHLNGDVYLHNRFMRALSRMEFNPPPSITNLDSQLMHLKKFGVLKLHEIYEWVKILRYFHALAHLTTDESLFLEWINNIHIPHAINEITSMLDDKGHIASGIITELDSLSHALIQNREHIRQQLTKLVNTTSLSPYLVDRQIHYLNEEECLLVRGGFNHLLKASVTGRSSSGFFYVIPESIKALKDKEGAILSQQEELIYDFCKKISVTLQKHYGFLRWINREFDRFDHYQARVKFSQATDTHMILPSRDSHIVLKNFIHPALHNPKPIDVTFNTQILMVTGVNAGGKTMLLKSLLSAVLMSKYLIPMKSDPNHTHIGQFKDIHAILEDPQSVKHDISTFAGRMVAFSALFSTRGGLVGVDEIELGTDSDEAASLFKVLLEELIKRQYKIVITTHHKRLASLMAGHPNVELIAALYNENTQKPMFSFLHGTIGKSYAFETALRYGIPPSIIATARTVYGKDQERLNALIERSSQLEQEMTTKQKLLTHELTQIQTLKQTLTEERHTLHREMQHTIKSLEQEYFKAIEVAKKAAKSHTPQEIHRQLNRAHKYKQRIETSSNPKTETFHIGDRVKHNSAKGTVIGIKTNEILIQTDEGMKLRVPHHTLKQTNIAPSSTQSKLDIHIAKPHNAKVKLDLHGLRAEDAIEQLDKFLSDSLLAGLSEVLVFHGIGTGKLAYAVREFLNQHPSVLQYTDAPPNMGGFGAKIITL
jgi:DNA mismatch repair protein MutS2